MCLLTIDLENTLHRVFVDPKKLGHCAVAKRRVFLGHRFDPRFKPWINLLCGLVGLVVDHAARRVEASSELGG